jgi:serine/threonine protein kinase
MGEVRKTHDSRLNRDVAIKISAQRFSGRFEREARATAALNHANIGTLDDIGPNYLVMELVEDPTLSERIRRGPVPIEEALAIARQLAGALEAAHERGIVHRDLKPANIKIRPETARRRSRRTDDSGAEPDCRVEVAQPVGQMS